MTDTDLLTVFVNERPLRIPPGSGALAAVRGFEPGLADAVQAGRGYLTDGRGIRIEPEATLVAGAIVRVVISARQPREAE